MGFKEFSAFKANPLFTTLVDEGQIQEPIFGAALGESNSELILGGRDPSRFTGNLTYSSIGVQVRISRVVPCLLSNTDTIQSSWQTVFDGINIDGQDLQIETKNVLIDTGSQLIVGDPKTIAHIYGYILDSVQNTTSGLWKSVFVTELTIRLAN